MHDEPQAPDQPDAARPISAREWADQWLDHEPKEPFTGDEATLPADPRYTIGVYGGYRNYQCRLCPDARPDAHLDKQKLLDHYAETHDSEPRGEEPADPDTPPGSNATPAALAWTPALPPELAQAAGAALLDW